MKISGSAHVPSSLTTKLNSKNLTTLLELVKPLSPTQALVKTELLGEITLTIKQALQTDTLYQAILQKKDDSWTLKKFFVLPSFLTKNTFKTSALELSHFIQSLSQGKSPQKILLESLTQQLIQASSKEETTEILSQILHLVQSQEALIPLRIYDSFAYVKFKKQDKKNSKKDEKNTLYFEAYFTKFGLIDGSIFTYKTSKQLFLHVQTQETKAYLLKYSKLLGFQVSVSVATLKPTSINRSLLDTKA